VLVFSEKYYSTIFCRCEHTIHIVGASDYFQIRTCVLRSANAEIKLNGKKKKKIERENDLERGTENDESSFDPPSFLSILLPLL
jgi:hypothetical protein